MIIIGTGFLGRGECKVDYTKSITSVDFLTQPVTHPARRAVALLIWSA